MVCNTYPIGYFCVRIKLGLFILKLSPLAMSSFLGCHPVVTTAFAMTHLHVHFPFCHPHLVFSLSCALLLSYPFSFPHLSLRLPLLFTTKQPSSPCNIRAFRNLPDTWVSSNTLGGSLSRAVLIVPSLHSSTTGSGAYFSIVFSAAHSRSLIIFFLNE